VKIAVKEVVKIIAVDMVHAKTHNAFVIADLQESYANLVSYHFI